MIMDSRECPNNRDTMAKDTSRITGMARIAMPQGHGGRITKPRLSPNKPPEWINMSNQILGVHGRW